MQKLLLRSLGVILFFKSDAVLAHAFGSRYDLPLPLWLYLTGAGSIVAVSFIFMCVFLKPDSEADQKNQINLTSLWTFKWITLQQIRNLTQFVSLFCFVFLLAVGFFGSTIPLNNLTSIFVWVIWWVGMAFISALFGNIWLIINPWTIIFKLSSNVINLQKFQILYPRNLGFWPSVIFLFFFAWMELISGYAENPQILSTLIILYSITTWIGMIVYGEKLWLQHGEVFHSIFETLSRFSPSYVENGHWHLRIPALGLIPSRPASFSKVCFILLLLSTVTFDGILETPFWVNTLSFISENMFLRPILIALDSAGVNVLIFIKSVALLLIPCTFLLIYAVFCHVISEFGSGGRIPTKDIIGYFIFSIVPIAIAYHLSHYLSYLLIAGQQIIPLLSDPFARGWNLFGTVSYTIDIGIINAKIVWFTAVFSIVTGHVFAVFIGHRTAIRVFPDKKAATRSQYPMMVLMISYTMLSLWILSQPIVE